MSPENLGTITFDRPADRVGIVTYTVCYSSDLVTWTPLDVEEEIESETDGIQSVQIVDPAAAGGRRFYKVSFTSS